jgi:hypothetical protein
MHSRGTRWCEASFLRPKHSVIIRLSTITHRKCRRIGRFESPTSDSAVGGYGDLETASGRPRMAMQINMQIHANTFLRPAEVPVLCTTVHVICACYGRISCWWRGLVKCLYRVLVQHKRNIVSLSGFFKQL